ncbi:DUF971 domain-containing protein [Bythopirellula polymerisocia]|uniref:Gamma-butyrobetaine hydroxylase-like N-terminal domain-containing protein n=1 Tax=Bythopirellula polymerisocia TaxID=2528003 RepID=A0A5C6CIW0_9BACT|nr:DUF971 domain-containing protein [Bythopirellula polymerisocia]TWU22699.1 hypothetical protein Pla144_41590 [Bythopirellula polymerisocia]
MIPQPTELKLLNPDTLQIAWNDGLVGRITIRELRENCPCANCIEKRSKPEPIALLPILKAEETQPLRITKMDPQGRYAYAIDFSDGHNTGLFTLDLLRELGEVVGDEGIGE